MTNEISPIGGFFSKEGFVASLRAQSHLVALVVGTILLAVGGYFEFSERQFVANSVMVEATVIDVEKRRHNKEFSFRPVFEITRSDGSKHQYKGNRWVSPSPHQKGDVVPARYAEASGQIVSEALSSHSLYVGRILFAVGAVGLVLGVVLFFRRRPQA